ncbi:hypothetical protein SVIOM74S_00836 [Streptomyces violarus]
MARTKEFDPDAALQSALELFWRRGYEATSMSDLVEHLGIGRASIYATFGSKHELYLKALDRYAETRDPSLLAELSQPGPALPAVRAVVRRFAAEAGIPGEPAERLLRHQYRRRVGPARPRGGPAGRDQLGARRSRTSYARASPASADWTSRSNNAGILRGTVPVGEVSEEEWDAVLRTNVTGVWLAMKHEIAHMKENGGGTIVNISSNLGAHLRIPNAAAYIASKAAVSALTRAAARRHPPGHPHQRGQPRRIGRSHVAAARRDRGRPCRAGEQA